MVHVRFPLAPRHPRPDPRARVGAACATRALRSGGRAARPAHPSSWRPCGPGRLGWGAFFLAATEGGRLGSSRVPGAPLGPFASFPAGCQSESWGEEGRTGDSGTCYALLAPAGECRESGHRKNGRQPARAERWKATTLGALRSRGRPRGCPRRVVPGCGFALFPGSAFMVRTLSFRGRFQQGLLGPRLESRAVRALVGPVGTRERAGGQVCLGESGRTWPALVAPGPLQRESLGTPCAGSAGDRARAEQRRPSA